MELNLLFDFRLPFRGLVPAFPRNCRGLHTMQLASGCRSSYIATLLASFIKHPFPKSRSPPCHTVCLIKFSRLAPSSYQTTVATQKLTCWGLRVTGPSVGPVLKICDVHLF